MSIFDKATHLSEQAAPFVSKAGETAYDVIVPEELITTTATFITDPVKRAEYLKFMQDNPGTTVAAALTSIGAGKIVKKVVDKVKKLDRYKKTKIITDVKPQKPKLKKVNGKVTQTNKGEVDVIRGKGPGFQDKTLAGDLTKGYIATQVGKEVLDEPFLKSKIGNVTDVGTAITPPTTDTAPTTETTATDKTNIFGAGTPGAAAVTKSAKTGNISEGLLGKMGTKDFWMTSVEGGSGSWDNRLFRLGEMMEYMGTPLSKRGKNPADRWTTATAAANKAAADAAAAQAKAKKGFVSKLSPADVGADVMTRLKKKPWFSFPGLGGVGNKYNEEQLTDMENLGKTKFQYWYENTNDYEQAMKETLRELELGL
jgi:hypothetical protein